jgi:hypothetical protein
MIRLLNQKSRTLPLQNPLKPWCNRFKAVFRDEPAIPVRYAEYPLNAVTVMKGQGNGTNNVIYSRAQAPACHYSGGRLGRIEMQQGMRQSAFDLFLLYAIGVLGLIMRRFSFPTAPVVVGMILGPLAEAQLRNAISIGEGSAMVFLQRPMSLTLLAVVVAVLVVPRWLQRRPPPPAAPAPARRLP